MAFFGLKTAKEVEEEKRQAAAKAEEERRRAVAEAEQRAKLEGERRAAEAAKAAKEEVIRNNYVNLSNLSKGSQVNFVVPYFDVFDPRFTDYGCPVAVHGSIVYSIDDMDLFQSINKNEAYSDEVFHNKLKASVVKFVKGVISNAPSDAQIPVVQLERKIVEISELVQQRVAPQVERVLGITVRSLDITNITIDKTSIGYRELKELTADLERDNVLAKHNANLSNFNLQNSLQQDQLKMQSALGLDAMKRQQEMQLGGQEQLQAMQLENQRETMRIQREEMQRASRLQTEQTFLGAHQANLNAFGQQPMNGGLFGKNSLDGAMPQMPGMPQMGGMPAMGGMKTVPQVQYMVGVNGQPAGPFDWNQLQQLVQSGQLTQQTQVWKQGMPAWAMAGQVQELLPLFLGQAPAMGGMPPMM